MELPTSRPAPKPSTRPDCIIPLCLVGKKLMGGQKLDGISHLNFLFKQTIFRTFMKIRKIKITVI
jgi:hypothetical protein